MEVQMKKFWYWFPRITLLAYAVFGGTYAIVDSGLKGLNLSGIGMLAIFAIFAGGLGYIAWTQPKNGGPIILIVGIFTVIIGFTYEKNINWISIFGNALPLIVSGGILTLEGFKLIKAKQ